MQGELLLRHKTRLCGWYLRFNSADYIKFPNLRYILFNGDKEIHSTKVKEEKAHFTKIYISPFLIVECTLMAPLIDANVPRMINI